jgi:23S rRNA (adenine2503-C2)-methyltransferase
MSTDKELPPAKGKALYGLDDKEIAAIIEAAALPKFRGAQLLEWLYKKNALTWGEIKNLPKEALAKLAQEYSLTALEPVEEKSASNGGSSKFLFRTADGHLLESVLISARDRQTVCVSTQLGCKIQCAFCASGKGGFIRDLTAGEIVEQAAWIANKTGEKITNIVYMGMGEPLDNLDEVLKSIRVFNEPWGFGLGARRITVSTSGIAPKILEFVERADGRVRLSISLHSSIDAVRDELVPINRKHKIKEIVQALRKVKDDLSREVTFEYILIAGVNDSEEEAEGVSKIAKPLQAKINIIPYNPIREYKGRRPTLDIINRFCNSLQKKGVTVMLRKGAGEEVDAACGQLRLDRMSNR